VLVEVNSGRERVWVEVDAAAADDEDGIADNEEDEVCTGDAEGEEEEEFADNDEDEAEAEEEVTGNWLGPTSVLCEEDDEDDDDDEDKVLEDGLIGPSPILLLRRPAPPPCAYPLCGCCARVCRRLVAVVGEGGGEDGKGWNRDDTVLARARVRLCEDLALACPWLAEVRALSCAAFNDKREEEEEEGEGEEERDREEEEEEIVVNKLRRAASNAAGAVDVMSAFLPPAPAPPAPSRPSPFTCPGCTPTISGSDTLRDLMLTFCSSQSVSEMDEMDKAVALAEVKRASVLLLTLFAPPSPSLSVSAAAGAGRCVPSTPAPDVSDVSEVGEERGGGVEPPAQLSIPTLFTIPASASAREGLEGVAGVAGLVPDVVSAMSAVSAMSNCRALLTLKGLRLFATLQSLTLTAEDKPAPLPTPTGVHGGLVSAAMAPGVTGAASANGGSAPDLSWV